MLPLLQSTNKCLFTYESFKIAIIEMLLILALSLLGTVPLYFWYDNLSANSIVYDAQTFWVSFFPMVFAMAVLVSANKYLKAFTRASLVPGMKWLSIATVGGIVAPIVIFAVVCVLNQGSLISIPDFSNIIYIVPIFCMAYIEETVCRFYFLKKLKFDERPFSACILSVLIFSLFHLFNVAFSLVSFLNIFLVGIVFCLIYTLSRKNLLIVSIIHALWNFVTGVIMGGYVSGIQFPSMLFSFTFKNANLINGGHFGIEGSIVTTIFLVLMIVFLFYRWKNTFSDVLPFSIK